MPPMIQARYAQDGMAYIPTAQREALRAQRTEIKRAQCIREKEIKKVLKDLSFKFEVNSVPSSREIQMQVQQGLQTLAQ
jgi:hypothetical protein